jgi:hypothetical protein
MRNTAIACAAAAVAAIVKFGALARLAGLRRPRDTK